MNPRSYERGQSAAEYVLIIAFVILLVIAVLTILGSKTNTALCSTSNGVAPLSCIKGVTETSTLTANAAPNGGTTGSDGNFWIDEYNTNKVERIAQDGTRTDFTVTGALHLSGMVSGPDGALWITDQGSSGVPATYKVWRVTTAGVVSPVGGYTVGAEPSEITVGADGALWICDASDSNIGHLTTSGTFSVAYTSPNNAGCVDIVTGPDNNVWYTTYGSAFVYRVTPSYVGTGFQSPSALAWPNGPLWITVSKDGNLWMTEYSHDAILRMTTAGVGTEFPVTTAGSGDLFGITTGPDSNLWFTDQGNNSIGRMDIKGNVKEWPVTTANSGLSLIFPGPNSQSGLWALEGTASKVAVIK